MAAKQPRAKVRLRLDRGTALIKQLGVSSVMCAILDLSETGCLCRVNLEHESEDSANAWRRLITPGRILTLEVTEPPELRHLQFNEAEVRWVKSAKEHCLDFGLLLKNLDPEHVMTLNQAMMVLASNKLRKKYEGESPIPQPRKSSLETLLPTVPPPPVAPHPTGAEAPVTKTQRVGKGNIAPQSHVVTTQIFEDLSQIAAPPVQAGPAASSIRRISDAGRERLASGRFAATDAGHSAPAAQRSGPAKDRKRDDLLDSAALDRQKRQPLQSPIFYQFRDIRNKAADSETYEGVTIDFNEGGFLIEGPLPLSLTSEQLQSDEWRLVGIIQAGGVEIACKFRVRSLKTSPRAPGLVLYGLQIVEMPDPDRRQLRELYIKAGLTIMRRR